MRSAVACFSLALMHVVASATWAQQTSAEAVTRPSKDVTLAFVRPGRVAKVLVKAGDVVKTGQVLVQLDDAADRAQLAQLEAQGQDQIRIKAAEARTEQSKVDFKKMEQAFKKGAASPLEVDHARLDVLINQLALELAKFEQKQAKLKADEARLRLDQMVLRSSIDGTVRHLFVEEGQSVDAQGDVVRVAQITPLWVDAAVGTAAAAAIRVGHTAAVRRVADPAKTPAVQGTVIFIDPQADSAVDTRTVRLEVPNTTTPPRPAGETVRVTFQTPTPDKKEP